MERVLGLDGAMAAHQCECTGAWGRKAVNFCLALWQLAKSMRFPNTPDTDILKQQQQFINLPGMMYILIWLIFGKWSTFQGNGRHDLLAVFDHKFQDFLRCPLCSPFQQSQQGQTTNRGGGENKGRSRKMLLLVTLGYKGSRACYWLALEQTFKRQRGSGNNWVCMRRVFRAPLFLLLLCVFF